MSSGDNRKEIIIDFLKDYYKKQKKVPTIKIIVDSLDGINKANFYKIFSSIEEACVAAGVNPPLERIESTKKAVNSRVNPKPSAFSINLDEKNIQEIYSIAYLDNLSPEKVIEKLIENDRMLRGKYRLTIDDVGKFSAFLRNCREKGLDDSRVLNSLLEFILIGVDRIQYQSFERLLELWKKMLKQDLSPEHMMIIYRSSQEIFKTGYNKCVSNVPGTIRAELDKDGMTQPNSQYDATRLISNIVLSLQKQGIFL